MLAIELPADVEARLEALARATGRTGASHAREAILEYLEDLEDARIAEKRLAEHLASGEEAIPLEVLVERDARGEA